MTPSSTEVLSIRRKVLAAAATLTIVGGVSAAATGAASAATPACGPACISVFSSELGTYADPNFVEAVLGGGAATVGQPVGLKQASSTDPSQDILPGGATRGGKVSDFYADGMVSAEVNSHYGTWMLCNRSMRRSRLRVVCAWAWRAWHTRTRGSPCSRATIRHDGVDHLSRPARHDAGVLPHRQRHDHRLPPPVRDALAAQRSRER